MNKAVDILTVGTRGSWICQSLAHCSLCTGAVCVRSSWICESRTCTSLVVSLSASVNPCAKQVYITITN